MKYCLLLCLLGLASLTVKADPHLDSLMNQCAASTLSLDSFSTHIINRHQSLSDVDRIRYVGFIKQNRHRLAPQNITNIAKLEIEYAGDQSISLWKSAIVELETRSPIDTVTLAYAINTLGEYYAKHTDAKKAIACFLDVVALFPPNSLEEELGYSNGNLGNLLNKQSDPGSSLPYLGRALDIFSHHYGEDNLYVSVIQNTLGMTYGRLGNPQKQLEYLSASKQIRALTLDACHRMMFEVNNNLALTYSSLGEHDIAEKTMSSVLDCALNNSSKDTVQIVHILSELTTIRSGNREKYSPDDIDKFYQSAILKSEFLLPPQHAQLITIYNNYAVTSLNQGKNTEALRYFQKAILSAYQPRSYTDGEFYLPSFGDIINPGVHDAKLTSNFGGVLYEMYEETLDSTFLNQAYRAFQLADSIMLTLKSTIFHGKSREALKYLSRRIYTIASTASAKLYVNTLEIKYLETLFQYIEKIKNWELLERFSYSSRSQDLANSTLAKQIDSLKNKLSFASVGNQFDSLEALQNNLLQQLKFKYPFYYKQLYQSHDISLAQLQQYCEKLKENWLIYFSVSGGSIGSIFVSSDTLVLHLTERNQDSIYHHKSELLASIDDKTWKFARSARQLYTYLIEPAAALIDQEHLVISGQTTIMSIPFDVLLTEDLTDWGVNSSSLLLPYMVNDHILSYMHSATFALEINNREATVSNPSFFAPDYLDSNLKLSWNQKEAQRGADHLHGSLFTGSQASEEQFRSNMLVHDLIHFAGHVYTDENMDNTFLLMHHSLDSLSLHEIVDIRTEANLIVLSGCKSGLGKFQPDAMISPAYVFTFAGAPNIISTLWSVDDQSTSQIFDYFYSHLSNQVGSIDALTRAKRAFIQQAPKPSRHPFYWAPSIYYGKEVKYIRPRSNWPYFLAGGVLLLAAIFMFRRSGRRPKNYTQMKSL